MFIRPGIPAWDKPYTDRCEPSIMPLLTTVIGSFPKPPYLNIPDWFNPKSMKDFAEKHTRFLQDETAPEREELISRAIKETVQLQWEAGLDVITDGEMRRENYINHFCRKLKGFDFHTLFSKEIRSDATTILVPRIIGEVLPEENQPWVCEEWRNTQDSFKDLPMKVTLPGPMTIVDTAADQYYHNSKILGNVLAKIINREIKALESAGCKYIQVSYELVGRGGKPEGWRGG